MPLLIDADILAHQIATKAEEPTEFGDDIWVLWADAAQARDKVDEAIESILETTNQETAILCLSGPNNFRLRVDDSYKSNRQNKRPPMILKALKEYMLEEHSAKMADGLEGDDLIGILATGTFKDDHLIYSLDKDLRTVPGKHWSDWRHGADEGCVIDVTPEQAQRTFYKQVLTGDTTDGYKGCPGIGPKTADKILNEECSWQAIVRTYEKAALTEAEALTQARLAFILHDTHYKDGKPVLWTPEEQTQ